MPRPRPFAFIFVLLLFCPLLSRSAQAHGYAGDRFFPPTISTDDPFAVDELALPTVSYTKLGGAPAGYEVDAGFEFDKEILPRFSIGVSDTYIYQHFDHGPSIHGWDNLSLTAKYEALINDEHELIVSVGLESDVGRTGATRVGADDFSTLTPLIYFGKGLGDLPDSLGPLRPFAITGELGQSFPLSAESSNAFVWGFAVEYSLPYLVQNVRDPGLPHPFRDMIPLVEFSLQTSENHADRGITTGTINPGVLYENPYFQFGIEANIPINSRSGAHVGVTAQIWIYIDDLFPHTFGHPLFGAQP